MNLQELIMVDFEQNVLQNEKILSQNEYPGRGIIIGITPSGKNYIQIYWIMGRSNNSKNRIFEIDNNFVRTKAFDENKMVDPSLIIYYPIKALEKYHIVSNGDQTDTIYEYINKNNTFENALNTWEFEPDPPNYTPRISGFIDLRKENANYGLSILKSINHNKELCQRNYYNYNNFINGFGHCIHTYSGNGNPVPPFDREPFIIKVFEDIEENIKHFWKILNEENKISLLVKYINKDNNVMIKCINKNI
jgi:IMP cyclohydrolase